ncbi:lipocalin-like domain-containing protein [Sphingobacterium kitahiroshimense]|uniref:lipocalin-like domain-containing protein n=1 Tax=Sphingobacterium sp. B16(2022) TaxID=2914044 RepID=UPI00143CB993|nr:lipocalin-like domain-containing protein [Sphingobacterium sp. B16(2022)]NJI72261.1 lipocalin-like domain-containing protein [Sphingobacterium sp. B16(2022)]
MEATLFKRLIGTWTLVEMIEVRLENGDISYPMGTSPKGLIIYNPDGYMSVQIMNPERKNFDKERWTGATAEEYVQEGSTYLAYSGPFDADEEKLILSHTMFISLFPNWSGQTQNRVIRFENEYLFLESGKPFLSEGKKVVHKLKWKRAENLKTKS